MGEGDAVFAGGTFILLLAVAAVASTQLDFNGNGDGGDGLTFVDYASYGNANLAVLPDDYINEVNAWSYITLDYTVYKSSDATAGYNACSIKLDVDDTGRGTRECDTHWRNVNPGDRIVWRVWCKTTDVASVDIAAGGRIGIDLYGRPAENPWDPDHSSVIVDGLPHDYVSVGGEWYSGKKCNDNCTLETFPLIPKSQFTADWGTESWKLLYYDFTVPDFVYNQRNTGAALSEPHIIVGCIPWLDARAIDDAALAYFDDAELFINPVVTEEPPVEPPPATYTLTMNTSTGGTTFPTGVTSGLTGDKLVYAYPASGYNFNLWLQDGAPWSTDNPATVVMSVDHMVEAVFVPIPEATQYTLVMMQSSGGNTVPAAGTYVYEDGTPVSLTASALSGWTFDYWSVNDVNVSSSTVYSLTVDADKTVQAYFNYTEPSEEPEEEPLPVMAPASTPPTITGSRFESILDAVQNTLTSTPAPNLDNVVTVLEGVTPKSFEEIVEALKKAKL